MKEKGRERSNGWMMANNNKFVATTIFRGRLLIHFLLECHWQTLNYSADDNTHKSVQEKSKEDV